MLTFIDLYHAQENMHSFKEGRMNHLYIWVPCMCTCASRLLLGRARKKQGRVTCLLKKKFKKEEEEWMFPLLQSESMS